MRNGMGEPLRGWGRSHYGLAEPSLTERAWFHVCLSMGRLLRSARYSRTRIVCDDGALRVRKYRLFYAPFLVRLAGPLVSIMNTGVRVLPRRDWVVREGRVYRTLYAASIRIEADGTLVLPCLPGQTLASLLEDPELEWSARMSAIEAAVVALAGFHRLGFTHGDAMAENVLVELDGAVAHWIDFETLHDSSRPIAWRRADDVRALLATCLLRTAPEKSRAPRGDPPPGVKRAETLRLILDGYADEEVTRTLATSFTSVWRRPLAFHLGQAGLSFRDYREVGSLLSERLGVSGTAMSG
jgi:hypothetical protein